MKTVNGSKAPKAPPTPEQLLAAATSGNGSGCNGQSARGHGAELRGTGSERQGDGALGAGDPLLPLTARAMTSPRICICDRQPVFAKGLASLLKSTARGCSVVAATTSLGELQEALAEAPSDVVLLDAGFGLAAVDLARRGAPAAKVVLLGQPRDDIGLAEALDAGVSGYMLKQDDVSEICDAIRLVLRCHTVVPSHLLLNSLRSTGSLHQLTDLDRNILAFIARGSTNREIANELYLSERTVRRHVLRIYSKLRVGDRIEAALFAVRAGLVISNANSWDTVDD